MPREYNPWLGIKSTADKLSIYDTSDLYQSLKKFVNFDLINEQKVHLSVGAVRVATGQLVYFDNTKLEIKPEHIMGSCALPPGFPAVSIDDQFYWDGGVHSNTQLNLLLRERDSLQYLTFMVQLFDSYGTRPTTMDEVLKRQKDITYSSHHQQVIQIYRAVHNLRRAIEILAENLPENKKHDPALKKYIELGEHGMIHLARFHYKDELSNLSSKDFEFSLPSLLKNIEKGKDDVEKALRNPPWEHACPEDVGLILYELTDNPEENDSLYETEASFHPSN